MYYARLYIQSISLYIKSRLEYRHFFFTGIFSVLLLQYARFALLWVLLRRFQRIASWGLYEIGMLFSLWLIAHGLCTIFFRQLWNFDWFIRKGELDKFLIRPCSVLFQLFSSRLEPIGFGDLIPGIGILIYSAAHLKLIFGFENIFFITSIILGAMLIETALALVISTLSFWLVQTRSLNLLMSETEEHIIRYPITIYTKPFIFIISFVIPIAFMNYFPATLLLRKHDSLFHPLLGYLTPLIGLTCMLLSVCFWKLGLKNYQGTGS